MRCSPTLGALAAFVLNTALVGAVQATLPRIPHAGPVTLTDIRMVTPRIGWATTTHAVLRSADGGEHWHVVTPPGFSSTNEAHQFLDASTAWVATAHANNTVTLAHTSDGGHHWRLSLLSVPGSPLGSFPLQIDFVPPREGWLLLLGDSMFSTARALFHTTDGGEHWSLIARHPPISGLLGFLDGRTGWGTAQHAGGIPANSNGTHTIYITHDSGRQWYVQTLPRLPGYENSLAVFTPTVTLGAVSHSVLPMVLFFTARPRLTAVVLYSTPDRGRTWLASRPRAVGSATSLVSMAVVDARYAWVIGSGTLYGAQDGGRYWQVIKSATPLSDIGVLDFVTPREGFALQGHMNDGFPTLIHTADGGRTWRVIGFVVS
ncbi:MAG TPA: hypothetical protein VNL71_19425 [Chloroflexota bacterium]|nr:hypothetical protein [Chloroflexota bacterium]